MTTVWEDLGFTEEESIILESKFELSSQIYDYFTAYRIDFYGHNVIDNLNFRIFHTFECQVLDVEDSKTLIRLYDRKETRYFTLLLEDSACLHDKNLQKFDYFDLTLIRNSIFIDPLPKGTGLFETIDKIRDNDNT